MLIPPSIVDKIAYKEQTENIPCHVYEMFFAQQETEKKRKVCTFFFYENTGQLLANFYLGTFQLGKHEDSLTLSSLKNTLVLLIGIGRISNTLLATIRDCNF